MIINNTPAPSGSDSNCHLKLVDYTGETWGINANYGKFLYKDKVYMNSRYLDIKSGSHTFQSFSFDAFGRNCAAYLGGYIYALGSGSSSLSFFRRFDGTSWTSLSLPSASGSSYATLASSTTYVYAIIPSSGCYRWNGSSWSGSLVACPFTSTITQPVAIGDTIYISGYVSNRYRIYSFNGSAFTEVVYPSAADYPNSYEPELFVNNGALFCVTHVSDSPTYLNRRIFKYTGSEWTAIDDVPNGVTQIVDYQWRVADPENHHYYAFMSNNASSYYPSYFFEVTGE